MFGLTCTELFYFDSDGGAPREFCRWRAVDWAFAACACGEVLTRSSGREGGRFSACDRHRLIVERFGSVRSVPRFGSTREPNRGSRRRHTTERGRFITAARHTLVLFCHVAGQVLREVDVATLAAARGRFAADYLKRRVHLLHWLAHGVNLAFLMLKVAAACASSSRQTVERFNGSDPLSDRFFERCFQKVERFKSFKPLSDRFVER